MKLKNKKTALSLIGKARVFGFSFIFIGLFCYVFIPNKGLEKKYSTIPNIAIFISACSEPATERVDSPFPVFPAVRLFSLIPGLEKDSLVQVLLEQCVCGSALGISGPRDTLLDGA